MVPERPHAPGLPASMRAPVQEYVDLIRTLAGVRALALTVFGPVLSGCFDPRRHTVQSVLVVDEIDLALLRNLAGHGMRLGRARIAAPLTMTPAYIVGSLDTFPLELIEIQQLHFTVIGKDYFHELGFLDGHVRLQCERELKTMLIGLRQGMLASAGREKLLGVLERDVAAALMRTLRGLLWLKGHKEFKPAAEVLAAVESIANRRLSGIETALGASGRHGWREVESLYRDVEALGEIVNAW